jgi:hypothetical protein
MKENTDPGLELVDVKIVDEKEMNGYDQTYKTKGTRENETKREMERRMKCWQYNSGQPRISAAEAITFRADKKTDGSCVC